MTNIAMIMTSFTIVKRLCMCMCFTPKSCKSYECKLALNQESLSYVGPKGSTILGVVIQSSGTDKDVYYIDRIGNTSLCWN